MRIRSDGVYNHSEEEITERKIPYIDSDVNNRYVSFSQLVTVRCK